MTEMQAPTAVVIDQLKKFRGTRGWSAREFAERCRAAGAAWATENVIENIEGKRRNRDVTVGEMLVFAAVLDVPPLRLLMPEDGALAVTPDLPVDPMRLVLWANGTRPPSGGLPTVGFTRAAAPIALYRAAHDAIDAAKNADRACTAARGSKAKDAAAEFRDAAMRRLADTIRPVLLEGRTPPGLPAGWLDEMVSKGYLEPGAVPVGEGNGDGEN